MNFFDIPNTCGSCKHCLFVKGRVYTPTTEPIGICKWRVPDDYVFPPLPIAWQVAECRVVMATESNCPCYQSKGP